jgi:hypothetical protein
MSYFDTAYGLIITFDRAMLECRKHKTSTVEMLEALGNHAAYSAQEVLIWLGY